MLPLKGEFKDYNPSSHPEGFAFDVRNGVIYKGVYQNEEGTALHSSIFKSRQLVIIGVLPVKNGRKVFFSIRPDGNSEIGVMEENGYYATKVNYDLGFSVDYPIDAEAQYNYKDELIIAFTDGLNTPKVINLDNVILPLNPETIEMFPSNKEPVFETELINSGGVLKSGVYQIYIRYESEDGTITAASHITNPILVSPSSQNSQFSNFEGAEAGSQTNKAIRVQVTNIDRSYKFIIIGLISKIDGVIEAKELSKIPIIGTSNYYSISGGEAYDDVTLTEVLTPQIYYKTIKHLTQVDGALYGASVTEEEPVNLQKYANQIRLKWVASLKDVFDMEQSDKTHNNNHNERGYAHGEVYAFYIRFKLKAGGWTEAFHIPGRGAQDFQIGDLWFGETQLNSTIVAGPIASFLNEDIAINEESRYFQTRDTSRDISYHPSDKEIKGRFGYWENQNEVYPNTSDFAPLAGEEDLRGKKVRHHRFPSQLVMGRRFKLSSNGFLQQERDNYNKQYRDKLGVEIDFMPTLPPEIDEKIEGWELMYAERSLDNSTVLGEGIANLMGYSVYPTWEFAPDMFYDFGGNYKYKFGYGNMEDVSFPSYDKLKIYSFDALKYKGSLPFYIERFGHINITNTIIGGIGDKYLGSKMFPATDSSPYYSISAWNFSHASEESTHRNSVLFSTASDNEYLYTLKDSRYFPQGISDGNIDNSIGSEFMFLQTNRPFEAEYSTILNSVPGSAGYAVAYPEYNASQIILKAYKQNVYLAFTSQNLVSTGSFNLKEQTRRYYGGDTYLGYSSILTNFYNGTNRQPLTDEMVTSGRFVIGFISENRMNVGFRHEVGTEKGSQFYPKSSIVGETAYLFGFKEDVNFNFIGYNNDYTSINNITNASIYNSSDNSFVEEDVHKIIRSLPANQEQKRPSWKQFLANDYYILPRNRGKITNIEGMGSNLFVNTEESLFITTGHEVLKTNELEVAVGTGDIFAKPFRELMFDKSGYAGCQHKFGTLLTVMGYFFLDAEKGKVFMSNGEEVKDITAGRSIFFRDNLTNEEDNPFKGLGYTIGFDSKYQRLIISKISTNPFTVSYTPAMQSWTSSHDYFPNFIYNDRRELYSLKDNEVFVHNRENYGHYHRQAIKPFHIVGIINERADLDKLLLNLNWRTLIHLTDEQFMEDVTFHEAMIWNRKQSTGKLVLNPYSSIRSMLENQELSNIRRKKSNWNLNELRDAVIDNRLPFVEGVEQVDENIDLNQEFIYKRRLIDSYFFFKLLYNNQKIRNLNNDNLSAKVLVEDIDYKIKQVKR